MYASNLSVGIVKQAGSGFPGAQLYTGSWQKLHT